MARVDSAPDLLGLQAGIAALVALIASERDERLNRIEAPRRTEVVLAEAGLTVQQIAKLLGKNAPAVSKTIQRAKG